MKWKNHLEIADAVADQLSLSDGLRELLREGSIQPDLEGDKEVKIDREALPYRRRVRHHHADKRFIKRLLWKARAAYLEGREEDAIWCLGRALHYVQDGSVAIGLFGMSHDRREAALGRRGADLEAIEMGERAAVPSPLFIDYCLRALTPKKGSHEAMYQACLLSSALACAVLSDPFATPQDAKERNEAARRHVRLFFPLAAVAAGLTATVAFLAGHPWLALASLPLGALVLRVDSPHYFHLRQSAWFARAPRPRGTF